MEDRRPQPRFVSVTRVMIALLACGVIAYVVVFVVLLSNASFTERRSSKGNQFNAGNAARQLSKPDAIVDASGLRPGETRTGDIDVTNTGEAGTLRVTPK